MISLPDIVVYGFLIMWPGCGFVLGFAAAWIWRGKP